MADYIKPTFEQEWLIPTINELRSQPQYNSAEVRKKLNGATNVVQNFENPSIESSLSLRDTDIRYSLRLPQYTDAFAASKEEYNALDKNDAKAVADFRARKREVVDKYWHHLADQLVSLNVGKGQDIDFNIVSSVFVKGDNKVIEWLNKGYATYINKKSLELSAPLRSNCGSPQ